MGKNRFLKRHGIVRNAIREDILTFGIPALIVFFIGLILCESTGTGTSLNNLWQTVWGLVKQPKDLTTFPMHGIAGLITFFFGLGIMIVGQVTLWRNYSGTVVIKKDHQLIVHGIYRFTRNPIYLGLIIVVMGLPLYVGSLLGFLVMLILIPLILNRIRLEEKLLAEEFQEAFQEYKKTTKKLVPFIY